MELTAQQICDIIAASGKNGVLEITLENIRVVFKQECQVVPSPTYFEPEVSREKKSLTEDEKVELIRHEMDQLMIENPAEWDRLNSGDQNAFN